jgi:hypothetical protein
MAYEVRVEIASGNGAIRVDAKWLGTAEAARDIDRGDRAIGRSQETMRYEVCVEVASCDGLLRVNGLRVYTEDIAGNIKARDRAIGAT